MRSRSKAGGHFSYTSRFATGTLGGTPLSEAKNEKRPARPEGILLFYLSKHSIKLQAGISMPARKANKLKQSFSWWCFSDKGVDDSTLMREARKIGYVGVELLPDDKLKLAVDCGLTIATHGGHGTIENGLNDPTQLDRIEADIDHSLQLAVRYQIPNLIVFSGNRRPGLSDEEGGQNTAKALSRLAPKAEQAGVTLILELLNSRIDHKGYQCDRTQWGVDVVEMVGSQSVKLLYDIYHMQVMEGDLIRTIRTQNEHLGHYHTAGNPGRNDMDDTQELNYPPIFRAIAETGYSGYIGHEFVPKADPIAALKCAFELTERSLA